MSLLFIVVVLLCIYVLLFEFINWFHDTANAVATVIYTRALKPKWAVLWSWLWNLLWVILGGIGVAISIANLLPLAALQQNSFTLKAAFFLSLLLSSIIWNIVTWYRGLPCSSMHALIWSMLGVSLAYVVAWHMAWWWIPWHKLEEVLLSLLISPLVWFAATMIWTSLLSRFGNKHTFFCEPWDRPPVWWMRAILISTCTAVSFAHGSNDGQKGIGIMMAILVVFLPHAFNMNNAPAWVIGSVALVLWVGTMIGWKRIVVTIGEKIGKHHMTYGQGAMAEIVAAWTISLSSAVGLPVSTTHVLSSGVAGSMAARWWMKDLQMDTVKHIALAWILTLPVTMIAGFILYFAAVWYVG